MDKAPEKKGNRVRYTEEQKKEVLNFIKQYNADNKRGGQKVAAEKYNITQITLSNWMKKEKQAPKRRNSSPRKTTSAPRPSAEYATIFSKLADIHSQIAILEKQVERLDALRQEASDLQSSIAR